MRIRWGALLLAVAVVPALGGCARGGSRLQPQAPAAPTPPAGIAAINTDATAIMGQAAAGSWSAVSAEISAITSAWNGLQPQLQARGARAGLLTSIGASISALRHQSNLLAIRGTAMAANQLTSFVPDMVTLYRSAVPPQLYEMLYLTRAVQFDADGGHSRAVWQDARALSTQYDYIRPSAQGVDPTAQAQLDSQLSDLNTAVAAASTPAIPAMAGFSMPSSSSSANTSASSSTASPSSSVDSGRRTASDSTPASNGTPSLPAARRRTGTTLGSGPAAAPHTSGPVQSAAEALLPTLTALEQAYLQKG